MDLLAFRITNFRSIVDSKWVPFSKDGITVFVGQNESGKTSILDALFLAFSKERPTEDDYRFGASRPVVTIRAQIDFSDIESQLSEFSYLEKSAVRKYLEANHHIIDIDCVWNQRGRNLTAEVAMAREDFTEFRAEFIKTATEPPVGDKSPKNIAALLNAAQNVITLNSQNYQVLRSDDLASAVWSTMPIGVKFNERDGRLPNNVDIDKNGTLIGDGNEAANNFLEIAGIDLTELLRKDKRSQESMLNRANFAISEDFGKFWSQTIGCAGKLFLRCQLDRYDDSNGDRSGRSHLTFWINDGQNQLYPRQRSQGVSWFISFYLQLRASEKRGFRRLFLLDEPGANLHIKAQEDVLRLINKLAKNTCIVVYSTHSPQLLEYSKLYRVHAVQRDSDLDDSPSMIIDAHRLGTASSDTLSPILTAMGSNLSNQEIIKKRNNVILEEMSGYYYLTAFWLLTKESKDAHFIAATGVNKIEPLANMFLGWGLDFIVAFDDDQQGREVYKSLLKNMFGDDVSAAQSRMLKFPDCRGIEDVFSPHDLKMFILNDCNVVIDKQNSEFMKTSGRSKPVLAYQFLLKVRNGELTFGHFDPLTQSKITQIVGAIVERLK